MNGLRDKAEDLAFVARRKYRIFIDKVAIYPRERWIGLFVLGFVYALRIFFTEGYAVITYLLGLYYLN